MASPIKNVRLKAKGNETDLETLNALLGGPWSEAPSSGMLTNPHPVHGGIIDSTIKTHEWFVVFNLDGTETLAGFQTREAAIKAFIEVASSFPETL